MDLEECKKKGFIKRSISSVNLIKSLVEVSNTDGKVVKSIKLSPENIRTYFAVAYDALREVLEAICELKGFKVSNPVCLGELLNKLLPEFDFQSFDRFRYIRNSIKYYGANIDLEQGKEIINKIFIMKQDLINKYLKEVI